jgi:hypothetical protein
VKETVLLIIFVCGISAGVHAQDDSRIGFSVNSGFSPAFQIHEAEFTPGYTYGFQLSFYDSDFTRLRYAFYYSRGYHRSVSYSAGLSAGYVISMADWFSLTPGLGVTDYKMKDRTCRTSLRSILNTLFDVNESCPDDSHVSFNPFLAAELKLSEPFSILLQVNYHVMLSNVRHLKEIQTETLPDGTTIEREIYESGNSFYSGGIGLGIGFKINLF